MEAKNMDAVLVHVQSPGLPPPTSYVTLGNFLTSGLNLFIWKTESMVVSLP